MASLLEKGPTAVAASPPTPPSYVALRRLDSAASILSSLLLRTVESEQAHAELLLPLSAIRHTLAAITRLVLPFVGAAAYGGSEGEGEGEEGGQGAAGAGGAGAPAAAPAAAVAISPSPPGGLVFRGYKRTSNLKTPEEKAAEAAAPRRSKRGAGEAERLEAERRRQQDIDALKWAGFGACAPCGLGMGEDGAGGSEAAAERRRRTTGPDRCRRRRLAYANRRYRLQRTRRRRPLDRGHRAGRRRSAEAVWDRCTGTRSRRSPRF